MLSTAKEKIIPRVVIEIKQIDADEIKRMFSLALLNVRDPGGH